MVYVSTHAGRQHSKSEDSVLIGTEVLSDTSGVLPMPNSGFICVADGVGGNYGGEQASNYVLNALAKWKSTSGDNLKSYLVQVNEDLIEFALGDAKAPEMATTLTGICITDEGYKLVHIGNTRAYIKQGQYLKQLTSDHTTYNWLMSSGQLDAAERCNKSEITNCFGGKNPDLLSKLYIGECQQFTLALLTSDGVHDYVDIDTLEEIVTGEGPFDAKCEKIARAALDAGSEDDLSVVIISPLKGFL